MGRLVKGSSEQYRNGMILTDENSYYLNKLARTFSKEEIDGFTARAKELNKNNDGDAASFYLRRR